MRRSVEQLRRYKERLLDSCELSPPIATEPLVRLTKGAIFGRAVSAVLGLRRQTKNAASGNIGHAPSHSVPRASDPPLVETMV
ncbi:hypothetical protein MTO96_015327 [Rhipicephalus appendiculatus]